MKHLCLKGFNESSSRAIASLCYLVIPRSKSGYREIPRGLCSAGQFQRLRPRKEISALGTLNVGRKAQERMYSDISRLSITRQIVTIRLCDCVYTSYMKYAAYSR